MFFDSDINKYVIHEDSTIIDALRKIESTHGRIVFIVSEKNSLRGVVTNGDVIRWMVQEESPDLSANVMTMANTNYYFATRDEHADQIHSFLKKVLFVPIVDHDNHLVSVARREMPEDGIQIGDQRINESSNSFIISEIGNNHNGDLELAKKLVDESIMAGADCAKFQMRHLDELYQNQGNSDDHSENLGSQYTLDLLSRFQLSNEELFEVFDYCKTKGILPLCTPWDTKSLDKLEQYGMPAYKVASADFTNQDLLAAIAKTGKPMICSTGMSTEDEIVNITKFLKGIGATYILLHCNSTYPAPFDDINLKYMNRIAQIGECLVGYSGHERGISVSIAAAALGAKVIERHITLDKNMEGNDHKASLLPGEFKAMVSGIREVERSLGNGENREMSQGEMMNRVSLAKSIIAGKKIKQGQVISKNDLVIKSPGKGLQPIHINKLIGKKAKHDFEVGDFFYPNDIQDDIIQARDYHFDRPWGIPVRYHDFKKLSKKTNMPLVEFHLSYKDLDFDIDQFFDEHHSIDFVVHSPELFENDHTLDLCSLNEDYRKQSIKELQRVIDISRKLRKYFTPSSNTLIVTNVGGFTSEGFLSQQEKAERYEILKDSLSQLDTTEVEIIPQTMPPFPWHFGGQQYHNLFVDADEIVKFCSETNMRICLDTSHSKLATNYYGLSFYDFLDKTLPYNAHFHFADSKGNGGEGLQINEGEIDFAAISPLIQKKAPNASFIPEIWQGHENDGEGGWIALERLEKILK